METVGQFLSKLHILFSSNSTIMLLVIYPKELKVNLWSDGMIGGPGGNEKEEHRGFQDNENILYEMTMHICLSTFVQAYRKLNIKSEP